MESSSGDESTLRYDEATDMIQIKYNDSWVDWKSALLQALVLFDGQTNTGVMNQDISGGFLIHNTNYGTSITVYSYQINIIGYGNDTSGTYAPSITTTNMIDLTNFSKLTVHVFSCTVNANTIGFSINKNRHPYSPAKSINFTNGVTGDYIMDLSTITGSYYIVLTGYVSVRANVVIDHIMLS